MNTLAPVRHPPRRASWPGSCVALLAAALAACSSVSSPSPYARTIAEISALIETEMAKTGTPAVSIALVDGDRIVWARGFGYADKENGVPATERTVYQVGSVSKTMAGAIVMQHVDRGLIDLDAPLTRYLPQFRLGPPLAPSPLPAGTITPRSMLTHLSGIPGDLLNDAFSTRADPGYADRMLETLAELNAVAPVGTVRRYSNTAITLLQPLVEAAGGRSFAVASREFFDAAGMPDSSFFLDGHPAADRIARTYLGGAPQPPMHINIAPAGSVLAPVVDMARFAQMILARGKGPNGRVLSEAAVDEMLSPQNRDVPLDLGAGIGLPWELSDPDLDYAGRIAFHIGGAPFSKAHLELLLDHGLAIAVSSNAWEGEGLTMTVARRALQLALLDKKGIARPAPPIVVPGAIAHPPREMLDGLAGLWIGRESGSYDRVAATADGIDLTLDASRDPAGAPTALLPRVDGWLEARPEVSAAEQATRYAFATIGWRDVLLAQTNGGDVALRAERLPAPAPISAAWTGRTGHWTAVNLAANDFRRSIVGHLPNISILALELTIAIRDGHVVMGRAERKDVIVPIRDDLGYVAGLGRRQGEAVRVVTVNGVEEIRIEDLRFRKQ